MVENLQNTPKQVLVFSLDELKDFIASLLRSSDEKVKFKLIFKNFDKITNKNCIIQKILSKFHNLTLLNLNLIFRN